MVAKRNNLRSRVVLPVLASCLTSCTSLLPLGGDGAPAGWSLATVEYVETSEQEVEERLSRKFDGRVKDVVDQLMEAHRVRLSKLEQELTEEKQQLVLLQLNLKEASEGIERASLERSALTETVSQSLDDLNLVSRQIDEMILNLDTRMTQLPGETLREFNRAIEGYLSRQAETVATAGVNAKEDADPETGTP